MNWTMIIDTLQRDLARFDLMDVCVYLGKSTFLEMYRAESESIGVGYFCMRS